VLSRRLPMSAFARWMLLVGLLWSLPCAGQGMTPAASTSLDIISKVILTPSPFASLLKDAQEKANPQQAAPQQQPGHPQGQQATASPQQAPQQQARGCRMARRMTGCFGRCPIF
jgi:hypothetical protein